MRWIRICHAALLLLSASACTPDLAEPTLSPGLREFIVAGTWNIEFLHDRQTRGFPEFFAGGPLYPPRNDGDYAALAAVIRDALSADLLALQEVNGLEDRIHSGRSAELDRLVGHLGFEYRYVLTQSGGTQRVAILWNSRRVTVDTVFELHYPELNVGGADVFPRDPLVARVLSPGPGGRTSDLLFVALHLASGRDNHRNHDRAFELLIDTLVALTRSTGNRLSGEREILIAGDLNLDYFDDTPEPFLEAMDTGDWHILASPGYSPTRLGGVPLLPDSRLDYLIATDDMIGDRGPVTQRGADVHWALTRGQYDEFRRVYSDHVPVTVKLYPAYNDN